MILIGIVILRNLKRIQNVLEDEAPTNMQRTKLTRRYDLRSNEADQESSLFFSFSSFTFDFFSFFFNFCFDIYCRSAKKRHAKRCLWPVSGNRTCARIVGTQRDDKRKRCWSRDFGRRRLLVICTSFVPRNSIRALEYLPLWRHAWRLPRVTGIFSSRVLTLSEIEILPDSFTIVTILARGNNWGRKFLDI